MKMSDFEDLKEVLDLVKELRQQGDDQRKQAVLLMKIAKKLQPHIPRISEPVSLAWGIARDEDEYSTFTPESSFSVNDLSSGEGIILWSTIARGSEKFWLLSSGKFLYVRTLEYKTDVGIGWGYESWVGGPIESEDPSKLPQVLESILCDNILRAVLKILVNVSEIDERSFQILLNFPQRFVLSFLRSAPCSNDALTRYGERYGIRGFLVKILSETEDKFTCSDVLEILNKMSDRDSMMALIRTYMYRKSDALRPLFNSWREKIIKSS